MDGTITYVIGRSTVIVIDPGCDAASHLDALASAVAGAGGTIVVTHEHPDHSAGAEELAARTGLSLAGAGFGRLDDGTELQTDEGSLTVLRTPGHSPDHVALHWPTADAIFCGDLMMGGIDTTVIAAPEGNLRDYLASLERLRKLHPSIIYPAHGPPFTDPETALDRYVEHRLIRLRQVRDAMDAGAHDVKSITDLIYGDSLDVALRPFAEAAVSAYLVHIEREGAA